MANNKTQRKHRQRKQRSQRQRQRSQRQRSQRQRQRSQRQRQRSQRQRQRSQRQRGGQANVEYNLATESSAAESLKQGAEFQNLTRDFHGGAVFSGAPLTAADSATLDSSMEAAAGVSSLREAFGEIKGMTDPGVVTAPPAMAGGRRRKHRKASRKQRKASRKQHKASRKHRKTHRRRQGGGGVFAENAAPFKNNSESEMLLDNYSGAGLNREWESVAAAKGGDYMGPSA